MKTIIVVVLALLLTAPVWGQEIKWPPSVPWVVPITGVTASYISPEEARAQQIRQWAASGEICRVLGP